MLKNAALILALAAAHASANMPDYGSSKTNAFFSGVLSGNYAAKAAGSLTQELPLIGGISKIFSLEDETVQWIERESARYARGLMREQIVEMGLNPFSLAGYAAVSDVSRGNASASVSSSKPKLRARVSTHRVSLSFLVRF